MLLAAAGQAAPYTYDSSATRKIGSNSNNNNNNNNNNVSNVSAATSTPTTASAGGTGGVGTGTGTVAITARPTTTSSIASSAATALMKTLSVRLHRGTEFIKDTVQKALVMSATTPVTAQAPLDSNQSLKRKLIGAGGIMGSGGSATSSGPTTTSSSSSGAASSSNTTATTSIKTYSRSSTYVVPTAAFLRKYTVAPSELHRSASARKRNASTDSLLMDLCIFKPIRPMPITPIKINKARGFELKRPKFMPPAANAYSDADEDEDEDEDENDDEEVVKEPELVVHKPKLSTLILPQNANASAFVPHEVSHSKRSCSTRSRTHSQHSNTKDNSNSNTHTSGTDAEAGTLIDAGPAAAKPKAAATKRRRRAPLLTAKRRRQTSAATKDAAPAIAPPPAAPAKAVASAATAAKRRKRNTAAIAESSKTISPASRKSPPMTRQRARLQISARSK